MGDEGQWRKRPNDSEESSPSKAAKIAVVAVNNCETEFIRFHREKQQGEDEGQEQQLTPLLEHYEPWSYSPPAAEKEQA